MAQKIFISTDDKLIASDLLCFLQNKLCSTANDDIVTSCCNFYSDEYVQHEKESFYSAIGKKLPRPRVDEKKPETSMTYWLKCVNGITSVNGNQPVLR